ncbi:MAG: hypothetical protein ACFB21_00405 [Opitutales bacterium]
MSVLAVLLLAVSDLPAQAIVEDNREVKISVRFPWSELSGSRDGYSPVYVTIDNKRDRRGRWYLRSSSGYQQPLESVFALDVPSTSRRSFELLVPYEQVNHSLRLQLTLLGDGLDQPWHHYFSHHSSGSILVGLSAELNAVVGVRLGEALGTSRGGRGQLAALRPSDLPEDWRAYLAFDRIWFSASDWAALTSSRREALLNWVMQGGHLRLLAQPADGIEASFRGVPAGAERRPYGLGVFEVFSQSLESAAEPLVKDNGRHFRPGEETFFGYRHQFPALETITKNEDAHPTFRGAGVAVMTSEESAEHKDWFSYQLEAPQVNFPLLIVSVTAFGIIVGPVNFFLFAKGRRRWRVFLTIPGISLAFTAVLLLIILLSEGLGGRGYLSRMVVLDPERNLRLTVQDDLSRTGVLMGQTFTLPRQAAYRSEGVALTGGKLRDIAGPRQIRDGVTYSGGFFASRRLQHNRMTHLASSREVMIRESGATGATLRSNLQAGLGRTFFVDEAGDFWTAERVGVGRRAKLQRSSRAEFAEWWSTACRRGGFALEAGPPAPRPGWFYAEAEPLPEALLEPLGGIRWYHFQTLIAGPVQPAS